MRPSVHVCTGTSPCTDVDDRPQCKYSTKSIMPQIPCGKSENTKVQYHTNPKSSTHSTFITLRVAKSLISSKSFLININRSADIYYKLMQRQFFNHYNASHSCNTARIRLPWRQCVENHSADTERAYLYDASFIHGHSLWIYKEDTLADKGKEERILKYIDICHGAKNTAASKNTWLTLNYK